MIGIIGIMDREMAKTKEQMSNVEIKAIAGMDFYKDTICHKETVVVRSDIGKVNAAVYGQIPADQYHVTATISTGIAGSLRGEINIGDVVLSTDALHHDVDANGFDYPVGQIPSMDVLSFPAGKHLLEVAQSCYGKAVPRISVHTDHTVSGDQFISDKQKEQWFADTFDGYCTEVEGAAIARTAYLNSTPYLITRVISDKADDSAEMDYTEFEAAAIHNNVELLTAMIQELP